MIFQQRVAAFTELGHFLRNASSDPVINKAYTQNHWFTPLSQQQVLAAWADLLTKPHLGEWLSAYKMPAHPGGKTIAIIMAGNIPLVGFHDLLCVLLSGNKALVKTASGDDVLPKWIIEQLVKIEPQFGGMVEFTDDFRGKTYDAVIATGSNNSNRYFEYYFRNKPHLFRKNRNSVAILTGNETPEDYARLADDVFLYFGQGCRNVSKLLLPGGFDFEPLFEGFNKYRDIIHHNKYANNYTYHKAIFLMNQAPHLDNGFVLLKEDEKIASPLSVVFYSHYTDMADASAYIHRHSEALQCVVSKVSFDHAIPFGRAQFPSLSDYADRMDTMKFLLSLG
jgi:hypothetical protein